MAGHALIHFAVQRLTGGDVGHLQRAVGGQFFRQATFAGTRAAEDQLQHSVRLQATQFAKQWAVQVFFHQVRQTFDVALTQGVIVDGLHVRQPRPAQ